MKNLLKILSLMLLICLIPVVRASAESSTAGEPVYFDNFELNILGDTIPEKFNEKTEKESSDMAVKLGFNRSGFTSQRAGFIFTEYSLGGEMTLTYGRDKSSSGEYLNIYYKENMPEILVSDSMKDIYPHTLEPVIKGYGLDSKKVTDALNKALSEIRKKSSSENTYTDATYEITVVGKYTDKGSNILVSLKETGNKGFNIPDVIRKAEAKFGPITIADAYYSYNKDGREPIYFEYIIPADREWESIKIRKVANVRRDNPSVKHTSDFTSAISDVLKEQATSIEYDFVTYANSTSTVPFVIEMDPYIFQLEQGLTDRNKISVIIEYYSSFSDYYEGETESEE